LAAAAVVSLNVQIAQASSRKISCSTCPSRERSPQIRKQPKHLSSLLRDLDHQDYLRLSERRGHAFSTVGAVPRTGRCSVPIGQGPGRGASAERDFMSPTLISAAFRSCRGTSRGLPRPSPGSRRILSSLRSTAATPASRPGGFQSPRAWAAGGISCWRTCAGAPPAHARIREGQTVHRPAGQLRWAGGAGVAAGAVAACIRVRPWDRLSPVQATACRTGGPDV
jgi:hypothetical protein